MSEQLKYTDRDVREHPEYYMTAINYLNQYQGEFEFLVSCKMRLAQDMDLSVGMIRGILNCMRADPRVGSMPEPEPEPEPSAYGNVVAFRKPTSRQGQQRLECPLFANGIYHHHHFGWTQEWPISCRGLYRINRTIAVMSAKIHTKYAVARNGSVVHRTTGTAWTEWYPRGEHEYGFSKMLYPKLIVEVKCQIRSVTNPRLYFGKDVTVDCDGITNILDPRPNRQGVFLCLCERCFGA